MSLAYEQPQLELQPAPQGLLFDYPRPKVSSEYFPPFHLEPSLQLPDGHGETYVRVYHGTDPQNDVANEMEVGQMVDLGDDEEFSRGEFPPYFNTSYVFEVGDDRGPLGVLRIIPHSEEKGLKTFHDLAAVSGDSYEEIEATFLEESGCESMEKVVDVTTLALSEAVRGNPRTNNRGNQILKKAVIHNLLVAFMDAGFERVNAGELTHCVSENEPKMHRALKMMGYPLRDINGYGDMFYDIGKRGKAMVCHPAYFSAFELMQRIQEADAGKLEHLSFAANALRVFCQAEA